MNQDGSPLITRSRLSKEPRPPHLGEGEVSGMSGLKGNQKNDEQKGSKDTIHGFALLCDASNATEL